MSRSEQHRASQKRRYDDYHRLLEETGAAPDWKHWQRHRVELRAQQQEITDRRFCGDPTDRRFTRDELKAWWLSKFSMDEIRAMAAGLDQVLA